MSLPQRGTFFSAGGSIINHGGVHTNYINTGGRPVNIGSNNVSFNSPLIVGTGNLVTGLPSSVRTTAAPQKPMTKLVLILTKHRSELREVKDIFNLAFPARTWGGVQEVEGVEGERLYRMNDPSIIFSAPAEGADMEAFTKRCVRLFDPGLCICLGRCAIPRNEMFLGDVVVATKAFSCGGTTKDPVFFGPGTTSTWMKEVERMILTGPRYTTSLLQLSLDLDPEDTPEALLIRALYEYQRGAASTWLWEKGFDRSKSLMENKHRIPSFDESLRHAMDMNWVEMDETKSPIGLRAEKKMEVMEVLLETGQYPRPSTGDEECQQRFSTIHFGIVGSQPVVGAEQKIFEFLPWGSRQHEEDTDHYETRSLAFHCARLECKGTVALDEQTAPFYRALQSTPDTRFLSIQGASHCADANAQTTRYYGGQIDAYAMKSAAAASLDVVYSYLNPKTPNVSMVTPGSMHFHGPITTTVHTSTTTMPLGPQSSTSSSTTTIGAAYMSSNVSLIPKH